MFKITGVVIQGLILYGYELESEDGIKAIKSLKETYELIDNGNIDSCELVETDAGDKIIYTNGFKLSELPLVSNIQKELNLSLVKKICKDGDIIGYVAKDKNGKEFKLSKEKVWELGIQKQLVNAIAYMENGVKIISGINSSLSNLESLII